MHNYENVYGGRTRRKFAYIKAVLCIGLIYGIATLIVAGIVSSSTEQVYANQTESKLSNDTNNILYNDVQSIEDCYSLTLTDELLPPIKGVVTCGYGNRTDPFDSTKTEFHRGVDIQGEWHTNIISVAEGKVVKTNTEKCSYGNYIIIEHESSKGKFYTLYAHLSEILVSEGKSINKGEIIGIEGGDPVKDVNPGNSTAHHLHFEIRESIDGNYSNPLMFVSFKS